MIDETSARRLCCMRQPPTATNNDSGRVDGGASTSRQADKQVAISYALSVGSLVPLLLFARDLPPDIWPANDLHLHLHRHHHLRNAGQHNSNRHTMNAVSAASRATSERIQMRVRIRSPVGRVSDTMVARSHAQVVVAVFVVAAAAVDAH